MTDYDAKLAEARKQRESFKESARWACGHFRMHTTEDEIDDESLRRYPDPEPEPKTVTVPNGFTFQRRGPHEYWFRLGSASWGHMAFNSDCASISDSIVLALASLLDPPKVRLTLGEDVALRSVMLSQSLPGPFALNALREAIRSLLARSEVAPHE